MPSNTKATIDQQIVMAIEVGEQQRDILIGKAAGMSSERLLSLPPSALALLGPNGLAAVVARKAELATAKAAAVVPSAGALRGQARSNSFWAVPLFGLAVIVGGLSVERVAPAMHAVFDNSTRSPSTLTWPSCPRLDAYVDGCIYTIGGKGSLSLADASDLLAIPLATFIRSNSHLSFSTSAPLPQGSVLVVWRGRLQLEGSR